LSDHLSKFELIQDRLADVQAKFLALLEEIPDELLEYDWADRRWTIKEELVHIVQVVEIMPGGIEKARTDRKRSMLAFIPAGFRHWINGQVIIPRKAKYATRETIALAYLTAHQILISKLGKLMDDDWEKGMPYPRTHRTVEQMAHRPVEHFEEHEAHIRCLLDMGIESK